MMNMIGTIQQEKERKAEAEVKRLQKLKKRALKMRLRQEGLNDT